MVLLVTKKKQFVPGVRSLPKNWIIKSKSPKFIEVERSDGLMVFFDRQKDDLNELANKIRLQGTKEAVVLGVGIVRGFQVSLNYAKRYAPETIPELQIKLKQALSATLGELTFDIPKLIKEKPKLYLVK